MEAKAPSTDSAKVKLLELIRENRTTLFGAFSSTISKQKKTEIWDMITRKAIGLGLLPAHRDAKYVRETYWQNLRRRTVKKMDDARRTGGAGGPDSIFDDVDKVVLDIIGKDSDVLSGLDIEESSGTSQQFQSTIVKSAITNSSLTKMNDSESSTTNNNLPEKSQIEYIDVPVSSFKESKSDLQIELLRQQIEYTKRDIYHRELAIFEKEQALSLSNDDKKRLLENSQTEYEQRKLK